MMMVNRSAALVLLVGMLGGACVLLTPDSFADDAQPDLRFRVQRLAVDVNEGSAIADVNDDGRLDVIAGRNWFANPDFLPRALRSIEDVDAFVHSNGDHAYDVNGDGLPDVISQSFFNPEIYWYENPEQGLVRGRQWTKHLLTDEAGGANEAIFLHDITGDGTPEVVLNSWINEPVRVFTFDRDDENRPVLIRHDIGTAGHGHGMGFGDLNGDGREDILVGSGWYERPEGDPLGQLWTFHDDWNLPGASCPIAVRDVDGDGRNDIVWGNGHDYGLHFWRQLPPADDGTLQWEKHVIDDSWSQAHTLTFADLTGDGELELVTGKRKWAHDGADPGSEEPAVLYYYKWNSADDTFDRHLIAEGVGAGLQINTGDISGNGYLDIVAAGKDGTVIVFNEGPADR